MEIKLLKYYGHAKNKLQIIFNLLSKADNRQNNVLKPLTKNRTGDQCKVSKLLDSKNTF